LPTPAGSVDSSSPGVDLPSRGATSPLAKLTPAQRVRRNSAPNGEIEAYWSSGEGSTDPRYVAYKPTNPAYQRRDAHSLSLRLRMELRVQSRTVIDDEDSDALCRLLNKEWKGLELQQGKATVLLNATIAASIPKELRQSAGSGGGGGSADKATTFAFVAQLVAAKAAQEAAIKTVQSFVEEIPFVGLAVRILQASFEAVKLAFLQSELSKVDESFALSIGVVERLVFEGAGLILEERLGTQKFNALIAAAKVPVGLLPGGSTGANIVTWAIKVAYLVRDTIVGAVRQAEVNQCLRDSTVNRRLLRNSAELCLYLPFVPGIDAWVLLGVLPPDPEQFFLGSRAKWDTMQERVFPVQMRVKTKDGTVEVWVPGPTLAADQDRVDWIFETCNKTLFDHPYRLGHRDSSSGTFVEYLLPLPVGFVQRMKTGAQGLFLKTPDSIVGSLLTSALPDVAMSYPPPEDAPERDDPRSMFTLIDARTGQAIVFADL